ncbi:MAG: nitroreductase family protein [Syntrophobacterales bacterium]|nr:nitroreductase family protein [Syntrophobacterales bacterium]
MKPQDYHKKTSYTRGKLGGGWWERGDPPSLFKTYRGIPSIPLPRDISFPSITLEELLTTSVRHSHPLSLRAISEFLFLSYAITAFFRDERYSFRTVPSAGALYPAELYIATSGIPDIHPGIYHYNSSDHSLRRIAKLEEFKGPFPSIQAIVTGILYRSSSKYRERAFRYVLLDGGHLLEQVFLAGRAIGLRTLGANSVSLPLASSYWEKVLSVDPQHEVALGTVIFEATPSYDKINYELDIEGLKSASKVAKNCPIPPSILEVVDFTKGDLFIAEESPIQPEESFNWEPLKTTFTKVSLSRRSRRDFIRRSVSSKKIFSFLRALRGLIPRGIRILFVLERCDDRLPDGIYEIVFEDKSTNLKILRHGSFLSKCAKASLDQLWLADAVLHVVIAVSVGSPEVKVEPALYRNLLLQAGRLGQRVYLTAEALGLGCCGIGAFYDEELRNIFSLPTEWEVVYLLGVGIAS